MPPDAGLVKDDLCAIAGADRDGDADQQWAQHHERQRRPGEVEHALQRALELALAVVNDGMDEEAVELLLERARQDAFGGSRGTRTVFPSSAATVMIGSR